MKVTRIVNEVVNSGVKNGKQWSQASVQLSDGQIVRIFNPVTVGDEVESEQNGQYTNWKVSKQSSVASGDVERLINSMGEELRTLSKRVEALEVELNMQKRITNEVESQVSDENEMPEDFLKF